MHPGPFSPNSAGVWARSWLRGRFGAHELVAVDGHSHRKALLAGFGTNHASHAADAHRAGVRDFVRQGHQELDGGAHLDVFRRIEMNALGADFAGLTGQFARSEERRVGKECRL